MNVTEAKLKQFFQVIWKKKEMAWTNASCFWCHEGYVKNSETVLDHLRLGRMQEHDTGRYSTEVNDSLSFQHQDGICREQREQALLAP